MKSTRRREAVLAQLARDKNELMAQKDEMVFGAEDFLDMTSSAFDASENWWLKDEGEEDQMENFNSTEETMRTESHRRFGI